MTERKDDVLMLASLEETPAVEMPEAEIVIPDELVDKFIAQEVEGLDDPESLEAFRIALRRFKKLHEAEIRKRLLTFKSRFKAYVYWHRRKLGEHTSGTLTYVAGNLDPNNTNIPQGGKLPNFTLKAIGVGFDIITPDKQQMSEIDTAIKSGRLQLTKGQEVLIDVPLSMVADYNPQVAVSIDGNSAPAEQTIFVLRNSKLERGMLPIKGIHFTPDDTVKIEVKGLNSIATSSTVPMTVILSGYIKK